MAATIKIENDKVEINDIATERTLQEIRKVLGGTNKSVNNLSGSSQTASDSLGSFGSFALNAGKELLGAATGTAKSIGEFAMATFDHQARLSTATDLLEKNFGTAGGMLAGPVGQILKAGEAYVDTLQNLSKSGISFSNDIFAMKNAAAQARMPLQEFAYLLQDNAKGLASFGGTATQGARLFSTFSKEFFNSSEGYAQKLQTLGMSTDQINEALLFQMRTSKMANFEDKMVRQQQLTSAVTLATEMDKISKLTGQERKEIEKKIEQAQLEGAIQAKFMEIRLTQGADAAQAAENEYKLALAEVQKTGEGGIRAFQELFAYDTVRTEMGRSAMVAFGQRNRESLAAMADAVESETSDVSDSVKEFSLGMTERLTDPTVVKTAKLGMADINQFTEAYSQMYESSYNTMASNALKLRENEEEFANASMAELVEELERRAGIEQEGLTRTTKEDGTVVEEKTAGTAATDVINNAQLAIKSMGAIINENIIGQDGALNGFADGLMETADLFKNIRSEDMQNIINQSKDYIGSMLGIGGAKYGNEATVEEKASQENLINVIDESFKSLNSIIENPQTSPEEKKIAQERQKQTAEMLSAIGALSSGYPGLAKDILSDVQENFGGDINQYVADMTEHLKTEGTTISQYLYDLLKEKAELEGTDVETVIPDKETYMQHIDATVDQLLKNLDDFGSINADLGTKLIKADLIQTKDLIDKAGKSFLTGEDSNYLDLLKEWWDRAGAAVETAPETKEDTTMLSLDDRSPTPETIDKSDSMLDKLAYSMDNLPAPETIDKSDSMLDKLAYSMDNLPTPEPIDKSDSMLGKLAYSMDNLASQINQNYTQTSNYETPATLPQIEPIIIPQVTNTNSKLEQENSKQLNTSLANLTKQLEDLKPMIQDEAYKKQPVMEKTKTTIEQGGRNRNSDINLLTNEQLNKLIANSDQQVRLLKDLVRG